MTAFKKLTETAWTALADALRTYHWYKNDFQTLVRARFVDAPEAITRVNFDGTKREATSQLIMALRLNEQKHQGVVIDALIALAEVDPDFPHLARLEDGAEKVAEAVHALHVVQQVTEQYSELAASRQAARDEAAEAITRRAAQQLHEKRLDELRQHFLAMHQSSEDPHARGYEFESFLNQLFELWDLNPRAAYTLDHEQVDGAFTFHTDHYILEARWWTAPLGPKEVNDFKVKVDGKARNTLGLCVSVSGFTDGAVQQHSQPQTPLILMDGSDLFPILEGRVAFDEVLERKRRHAAETGSAMYRVID